MKNLLLLFIISICSVSSVFGQVTKVNYVLNYNCESNLYEVKLKVLEGNAFTVPQRAQFNAQVSLVLPTGVEFEIVDLVNPIQDNQAYEGTVPTKWSEGHAAMAPAEMPEKDFHNLAPSLAPASFYNNLEEGNEVILFTCRIGDSDQYNPEYRFYDNETDPSIIETSWGSANYSNGFTMGGATQLYNENEYTSCTSTSTKEHQLSSLEVYPNPFSQEFNIDLSEDAKSITVLDYSGKQIYSSNRHTKGLVTIDANQFPSGIYMVHIKTTNSSIVRRIIKN